MKYVSPAGCFSVLDAFTIYGNNGLVLISISAQSFLTSSCDGFEFACPSEQRP